MTSTTISSREFNQDLGHAKKVAQDGPVIITDRGRPSHVLLSIEEYRRLTGADKSIAELLGIKGPDDCGDFEFPICRELARAADFS